MPSVADYDSVVRLVMMPDWARFVRLVMADPCWGPMQAVEKVDQHYDSFELALVIFALRTERNLWLLGPILCRALAKRSMCVRYVVVLFL